MIFSVMVLESSGIFYKQSRSTSNAFSIKMPSSIDDRTMSKVLASKALRILVARKTALSCQGPSLAGADPDQ